MEYPLVSVIIPVINCENYIEESINSVLYQNYKNIELIVIDGHSTDKTPKIAKSFKEVQFITQTNPGITEAFNLGIKLAGGDFIAFQSGDDIWIKKKLNTQIKFLLSNTDIECITAKFRYFIDKKKELPIGFKKNLINKDLSGPTLETFIARKSLFDRVGIFDVTYSSALDVEWFTRLNDMNIKMHTIQDVLLLKRIHNQNISLNEKNNQNQVLSALRKSIKWRRINNE
ncbi:MAG: glycosyltransferase [Thermodesulfobacteriota bacterium]